MIQSPQAKELIQQLAEIKQKIRDQKSSVKHQLKDNKKDLPSPNYQKTANYLPQITIEENDVEDSPQSYKQRLKRSSSTSCDVLQYNSKENYWAIVIPLQKLNETNDQKYSNDITQQPIRQSKILPYSTNKINKENNDDLQLKLSHSKQSSTYEKEVSYRDLSNIRQQINKQFQQLDQAFAESDLGNSLCITSRDSNIELILQDKKKQLPQQKISKNTSVQNRCLDSDLSYKTKQRKTQIKNIEISLYKKKR